MFLVVGPVCEGPLMTTAIFGELQAFSRVI
jgi:hypothetical protein